MYVCGVTIYDLTHIGHGRTFVAFDVMQRWLRTRGYEVTYVRNITDIDDKIIRRAAENGETPSELTARYIAAMNEDFAALGLAAARSRAARDSVRPADAGHHRPAAEEGTRVPGRRRRRQLRRAQVPRLRQALGPLARRVARRRTRRRRRQQARSARLRAVEACQAWRAAVGIALGRWTPGLAHRVLGDGE